MEVKLLSHNGVIRLYKYPNRFKVNPPEILTCLGSIYIHSDQNPDEPETLLYKQIFPKDIHPFDIKETIIPKELKS